MSQESRTQRRNRLTKELREIDIEPLKNLVKGCLEEGWSKRKVARKIRVLTPERVRQLLEK